MTGKQAETWEAFLTKGQFNKAVNAQVGNVNNPIGVADWEQIATTQATTVLLEVMTQLKEPCAKMSPSQILKDVLTTEAAVILAVGGPSGLRNNAERVRDALIRTEAVSEGFLSVFDTYLAIRRLSYGAERTITRNGKSVTVVNRIHRLLGYLATTSSAKFEGKTSKILKEHFGTSFEVPASVDAMSLPFTEEGRKRTDMSPDQYAAYHLARVWLLCGGGKRAPWNAELERFKRKLGNALEMTELIKNAYSSLATKGGY